MRRALRVRGAPAVRIAAVLLAAGEGRRMGAGPKALLELGGATFLARCLERLAAPPVERVFVVVGFEAERIRRESPLPEAARFVENRRFGDGMLSSVLCGLEAADEEGADAVLLHPVDHPLVGAETVARVAAALLAGAVVAVPSRSGRRGHPAGFARASWSALRAASPLLGAREVLRDHPGWIVHVPGDEGCVTGFNTPDDLAAHRPSRS